MSNSKVLFTMASGLAVGSLIAVLFAPAKGSEIRKKLSKRGTDFLKSTDEEIGNLKQKIIEKYRPAKEEAEKMETHTGSF